MNQNDFIGHRVQRKSDDRIGEILSISEGKMSVDFVDCVMTYSFPAAFDEDLILDDEDMENAINEEASNSAFLEKQKYYYALISKEINYLKENGGKVYQIFDGTLLSDGDYRFFYQYETDTELNFPEGTILKLKLKDGSEIDAEVYGYEDFTLSFECGARLQKDDLDILHFTADQWFLLDALRDKIMNLNPVRDSIAYNVACKGKNQVEPGRSIMTGQGYAEKHSLNEEITFIWGPPGTGKTQTLARIAADNIDAGKRILIVSYSNVSVDGAMLRVSDIADYNAGVILRYGYPRLKELVESDRALTSYKYACKTHPEIIEYINGLKEERSKYKKGTKEWHNISKSINKEYAKLHDIEKEAIGNALLVSTTISKALVDEAIYSHKYDTVIFDEASMAMVPQIIFAASLAKSHFVCMGDFRQLPVIVQNKNNDNLEEDIFESAYITYAVENEYGHNWLVLLDIQHRMHKDIADFVSRYMYNGMLSTAENIIVNRRKTAGLSPLPGEAICLLDLSYMYCRSILLSDNSRLNLLSAFIAMNTAVSYGENIKVGIITPYSAEARLLLAMLRDLRRDKGKFYNISCATVHQFQGSEREVIIYDAVDSFQQKYPGGLLTTKRHNLADRLFNVAMTRAEGKFVLLVNSTYMRMKKLSKKLMFSKLMEMLYDRGAIIAGDDIYSSIGHENNFIKIGDMYELWNAYITDLREAKEKVRIDIPGNLGLDNAKSDDLLNALNELKLREINIKIRYEKDSDIPSFIKHRASEEEFIQMPVTIIDEHIIWYGQPVSTANFICDGEEIETAFFPAVRFDGRYTAREIRAFLKISK